MLNLSMATLYINLYAQFQKFQNGELFDKIDVTREGVVDWDKFASHMLLEFYEDEIRISNSKQNIRFLYLVHGITRFYLIARPV